MVAISTKLTDTKKGCGSNHVKPESASEKKRSRLKTLLLILLVSQCPKGKISFALEASICSCELEGNKCYKKIPVDSGLEILQAKKNIFFKHIHLKSEFKS